MAAIKTSPILFFMIVTFLFSCSLALYPSTSQSCTDFVFPNNKQFASCVDLPVLNSFFHWTYNPSSSTVDIAYRHGQITSQAWVSWGINPTSKGMVGTQALVAYQETDGTMKVYTSPISSYGTQLLEGDLSFNVSDLSASSVNNGIAIFATLELHKNTSTINHVWQDGPISSNTLGMHGLSGQNVQSMGTLDLSSGVVVATKEGKWKANLRKAHGGLNVVSWGTMIPVGFLLARYLKIFQPSDPLWFKLHVICQCAGFFLGVMGWATGLALRLMSSGVHHNDHLAIGTTVVFLGILQVLALRLRPNKDHKYRSYWNIYHHFTGYIVIGLGIANVFIGYRIMNPRKVWEILYYAIFGVLCLTLVVLEVCKRYTERKSGSSNKAVDNVSAANPPENA